MFHDPNFAEFVNGGLEARMATVARHITTIIEGYGFAGARDDVDHKMTTTAALLDEKQKIRSQIKPQDFDHLMYGSNVTRLDYFPKDHQRTMANENLGFYNQFLWRLCPRPMPPDEDGCEYEPLRFDTVKTEFRGGRTNRQIERKSKAYRSSLARAASRRGGPSRGK